MRGPTIIRPRTQLRIRLQNLFIVVRLRMEVVKVHRSSKTIELQGLQTTMLHDSCGMIHHEGVVSLTPRDLQHCQQPLLDCPSLCLFSGRG